MKRLSQQIFHQLGYDLHRVDAAVLPGSSTRPVTEAILYTIFLASCDARMMVPLDKWSVAHLCYNPKDVTCPIWCA